MPASYPNTIKQWTDKQDNIDDVFAEDTNGAYREIIAIETELMQVGYKRSVRVATTQNGALATAFAHGQTVDGVVLTIGDRILLKDQTNGAENGIYTVNLSGAPTRAVDANTAAHMVPGLMVYVREGAANGKGTWKLTTTGTITLDTTPLVFENKLAAHVSETTTAHGGLTPASHLADIAKNIKTCKTPSNTWTEAIQQAINESTDAGIWIPDGEYEVDKLTIKPNGFTRITGTGKLKLKASATDHNSILYGDSTYNSTGIYIDGVELDGNGANQTGSFYVYYDAIVNLKRVNNVTIKNCKIYGCVNHQCGILTSGLNILIEGNEVYTNNLNSRHTCGIILGETGIWAQDANSRGAINAIVTKNYVHDVAIGTTNYEAGYGIYALACKDTRITNNYVVNCNWVGINSQSEYSVGKAQNIIIEGNVVVQDSTQLMSPSGGMFGPFCIFMEATENGIIANNTCKMLRTGASTVGAPIASNAGINGVTIENNIIETNTTNNLIKAGILIASIDDAKLKVKNNKFKLNQYTHGIYFYVDKNFSNVQIEDNEFYNINSLFTVYATGAFTATEIKLNNNFVKTTTGTGLILSGLTFDKSEIIGNKLDGVYATGVDGILIQCTITNTKINRNTVIGGRYGIVTDDSVTALTNCEICENEVTATSSFGLLIRRGSLTSVKINGNKIHDCGSYGMVFNAPYDATKTIRDIEISNNSCYNNIGNGMDISPTNSTNYTDFVITNNKCYDNRGTKQQVYGMSTDAPTLFVNTLLANNVCLNAYHVTNGFNNFVEAVGKIKSLDNIDTI